MTEEEGHNEIEVYKYYQWCYTNEDVHLVIIED
jgi:hypothetical protein